MNKKLKTLISVPASKKFFKVSISILMSALILLLSLTPFLPKFNYTPFKAFAVEIIPSKTYKITYDLPHLSKGITGKQREKAENNLSKTFGIPLSSLKQNEYLSKPLVYITYIPFLKKYEGFVKIGNIVSKFDKIKVLQQGTLAQNTKTSNSDSNNQSGILLTAYFTLNKKPLRANIFIMNNGSVLKYSSMTIQDQNDNVLAMFTYGKAPFTRDDSKSPANSKSVNMRKIGNSGGWETEQVLKHQVKYITINDPVGNTPSATVPALRLDAMSNRPFNNSGGANNSLAARSWLFGKQIADAYKNFFVSDGYGTVYAYSFVNDISNTIWQRFPSEINKSNVYPEGTNYSTIPIEISFDLKYVSIGYTIYVPYGGVKRTWTLENTFNHTTYQCNYGKFEALPCYTFSWNDKNLFWNSSVYDAITNDSPGSSYGGFYSRYETALYAYGDYLYANYSNEIDCGIKVVSATYDTVDYYYISVSETFPYVNLAG